MEKASKYKIIDTQNVCFGETIKAIPDTFGGYMAVDRRHYGHHYEQEELRQIPEKHAAYFGIHIFRFGIFLFAREYIKYHSYQFGCGIDFINSGDAYLDIELRVACFGIGVRFVWQKFANH